MTKQETFFAMDDLNVVRSESRQFMWFAPSGVAVVSEVAPVENKWWDAMVPHFLWSWCSWLSQILHAYGWSQMRVFLGRRGWWNPPKDSSVEAVRANRWHPIRNARTPLPEYAPEKPEWLLREERGAAIVEVVGSRVAHVWVEVPALCDKWLEEAVTLAEYALGRDSAETIAHPENAQYEVLFT